MEFHILGPIELRTNGGLADLRATKVRALLGLLLLAPNTLVTADTLASRLWDEMPATDETPVKGRDLPPKPAKTLQTYVTRLREALARAGAPVTVTNEHQAYCLRVDANLVDYHRFQQLAAAGRQAVRQGEHRRAVDVLSEAIALWNGPPLADLATEWIRNYRESMIIHELLPAYYNLFEAQLALGDHDAVLERLRPLLTQHDTDETLAGIWMRALAAADGPDKLPGFFRTFADRVRTSLHAEPSDQFVQLYLHLTKQMAAEPATNTPAPRQLPRPSPYFTGRDDFLAELDTLVGGVTGQPIVAIDGAAGVGKTELVVQWGASRRDRFPDGDLYVNANGFGPGPPIDASAALTTFLNALGLPTAPTPSVEEQANLLRRTLTGRRMLVVLDNVRDSEHARLVLAAIDSCPVLITSRQQLTGLVHRDGAMRVTLRPLDEPAAVSLVARRIGASRAAQDQQALRDLAVLCDGLPIGLRVAAEHIAACPAVPIRELVDGFQRQRRSLLDAGSYGDDSSVTLRAVFLRSSAVLEPGAQRLFRLLGLHSSASFSTAAAAALAGLSRARTEKLLDTLVGAHLVDRQSGDRFRFHDLLHVFAADLAAEESAEVRDETLRRLFEWYLGSVLAAARRLDPQRVEVPQLEPTTDVRPEIFTEEDIALRWCVDERANILATSRYAAELGYHDQAWRLVGEFDEVLIRYEDPRELLEIHQLALISARMPGVRNAKAGEAGLMNSMGYCYAKLNDFARAATHFRLAQSIYKALGEVECEAVALMNIATTFMHRDRFPAAINLYEHAIELYHEVDNTIGLAHTYHRLGDTYRRMSEYGKAEKYYRRALRLRADNPRGQGDSLTALGELEFAQGNIAAAIGYCEAALEFHRRALDTLRTAQALSTLADAYFRMRRYADAIRCGTEAVQHFTAIRDLESRDQAQEILDRAYLAREDGSGKTQDS